MIKNLLKSFLFKMPRIIVDFFYCFYNYFNYPNMRQKKCHYGELNKDKVFYVIRPRTDGIEGLMSLLLNVMKQLKYAELRGYIPVVDFQNYSTQYKDKSKKEQNVWEYYFKQTSEFDLEEVYNSSKVVLSGLNALIKTNRVIEQSFDVEILNNCRDILNKYICISEDIYKIVDEEITWNISDTLGLYLRGTDYVKLKPAGHYKQPTFEEAKAVVDEILEKYKIKNIFLVTEDKDIYMKAYEYYKEKLKIVSFDSFIDEYEGKDFLSKNNSCLKQLDNSSYIRGKKYLVKIIILSKCKYFVGGNTCGSWAANVFSDEYDEKIIFDLGRY